MATSDALGAVRADRDDFLTLTGEVNVFIGDLATGNVMMIHSHKITCAEAIKLALKMLVGSAESVDLGRVSNPTKLTAAIDYHEVLPLPGMPDGLPGRQGQFRYTFRPMVGNIGDFGLFLGMLAAFQRRPAIAKITFGRDHLADHDYNHPGYD